MSAPSGSRQSPTDPTENPLSGPDEETPSTQAPAAAATTPTPAPAPASPPPTLDGAQRRHLRGLAHPLKPIVFVGEGGVSDAVARALDEALTSHELVKVRLRQPPDKKSAAETLGESCGAAVCGVVGHTVVLYRPHPDEPKIQLPQRD